MGEADSFAYKPKQLAQCGPPDAVARLGERALPFCKHPVGVTNFLLAKTKANTAAKATAREQFVYGYMRSLRK